jgi:hypothetical protein
MNFQGTASSVTSSKTLLPVKQAFSQSDHTATYVEQKKKKKKKKKKNENKIKYTNSGICVHNSLQL